MISSKLFSVVALAATLCVAMPAAAQKDMPRGADALKNCPAFNGQLDPAALEAAMKKCPAFQKGKDKGFDGSPDKQMKRVVKALERNQRSAEVLIKAARRAGAAPEVVADLQRMSDAFRQVFMSAVSPEQIMNMNVPGQPAPQAPAQPTPQAPAQAAPQAPDQAAPEAMIITGPDGSTWLITPAQPAPQAAPAPQVAPQPVPRFATPPAPGVMPQQKGPRVEKPGIPPVQGRPSAIGRPAQPVTPPAVQPAPQGMPPAGFRNPQPEGELIIMEEETITPEPMPLWPTKDQMGKDGVLKYLDKRAANMRGN